MPARRAVCALPPSTDPGGGPWYRALQPAWRGYWPVDDAAAETFATELYQVLLQPGRTVGEALRTARATVQGLGHSIDWANYLHYGNQAFALKEAR